MQTISKGKLLTNRKTGTDYFVLVVLACSFFLVGMFRAFEMGNGRSVVSIELSPAMTYWAYVLFMGALAWIVFELVLRLYYFFVSMSIFSFAVPKMRAFYIFRLFYAIRNFVAIGLSFLLFVWPVFLNYLAVIELVVDFAALVGAFIVIAKKYLGELLSPFAWKAFLRPFVVYETIMIALRLGGVL